MDRIDIPFLSSVELGDLIRRQEVSHVEATRAYLDRIDQVDGKLNSYITVSRSEALQAAREAEKAILRGIHLGAQCTASLLLSRISSGPMGSSPPEDLK